MDFLKRHGLVLICGVLAVLSIVFGAMKLGSMSKVKRDMQEAVNVAGRFKGYKRGPNNIPAINRDAIEIQRERVATIQRHYEDILKRSLELNKYEPLVPVFPSPSTDQRYEFADAYLKTIARLLDPLHCGGVPTESDIRLQQQIIDELRKGKGQIPNPEAPGSRGPKGGPGPPPPVPTGQAALDPKTGLPTDEAAQQNAAIRAAVKRALGILCYCAPQALDRNEHINTIDPPKETEMWDAQLSLWIQQDVIAALARINDREAERIRRENGTPWVGLMPIKELVSIRVSPYVRTEAASERTQSGPAAPIGDEPALPAGIATPFANANISNDLFDVVQFTVKLVVDVRDIPMIVDEIGRNRFHRPLRIDYSEEPPNLSMSGKIYGSEPNARLVVDFETCFFFSDSYAAMMPDDVLTALGRQRAKPKAEGAAPGR